MNKDPGKIIKAFVVLTGVSSLRQVDGLLGLIPLLATFVALYGIWTMKKWGAYLLFALTLIGLILLYVSGEYADSFNIVLIGALIILLIWFWALRRKWQAFE